MKHRAYVRIMDLEIDALGLLCPLPVLRLRKRMEPLQSGAEVRLIADDPAAIVDVPHFCNESGHSFIGMTEKNGQLEFTIRKG
ncbi:sulfurtransferase TusA family protein [Shimia sp. R11_0]|uniref:sulfurtransferase TusA family protein n=1 Tax=Shimia sp. R11_0 TaxID=2821096 RepID=UPI001FFE1E30|nr:sulfurtransferase TusA family protein [Shimia sp. R11_0]